MASFVEEAVLLIKDSSSAKIRKINKELQDLFKTTQKLKSIKLDLGLKDSNIKKGTADVKSLVSELNKLKSSSKVNINVRETGLQAVERELTQLRNQARRAITQHVNVKSHGRLSQFVHAGREMAVGFRSGLMGLGSNLAHALGHELGTAAKEGATTADIGSTLLKLQQMPATQEAAVRESVRQLGEEKSHLPGGEFLNTGERLRLFAEALPTAKGEGGVTNVAGAKAITSLLEEQARLGFLSGQTKEESIEGVLAFVKGMDMRGKISDTKTGVFDAAKMEQQFEYVRKLQPEIGKELTGTFYKSIIKYASQSRFALSDRSLGGLLMMGEDEGTRAAVGMNQLIKQLQGLQVAPAQLAYQEKMGLINTTETKSGGEWKRDRRGRLRQTAVKTKTTAAGSVDREMLATDPFGFVNKYVLPLMKKEGLDANSPADAATMAAKLVSTSTAVDNLTAIILKGQEIALGLDRAEKRDPSVGHIRDLTQNSVRGAVQGLDTSLQDVMGQTVMATAPLVTPVMNTISAAMSKAAATIADPKMSLLEKGEAGGVAAYEIGKAVVEAKPLMLALGAAAPFLGKTAGLTAMLSGDKGVQALGGAGLSLMEAADELKGAAGLQSGLVGKIAGLFPLLAAWEGGQLAGEKIAEAAGPKEGHNIFNDPEWLAKLEKWWTDNWGVRDQPAFQAEQGKPLKIEPMKPPEWMWKPTETDLPRRTWGTEPTDLPRKPMKPIEVPRPSWLDEFLRVQPLATPEGAADVARGLDIQQPPRAADILDRLVKPQAGAPMQLPGALKPAAVGSFQTNTEPSSGWPKFDFQPAADSLSSIFSSGASELASTSSSFESVFMSGASALQNAGASALASLQAGASGVGAVIGSTAASLIAAAGANIHVSVATAPAAPDTGSQRAAE
jgi:hypothetical protein